jgi:hypothetical protein
MNRTATLAILLLLIVCASASVLAQSADPVTYLAAFSGDGSRLALASHRGGIRVLSVPDLKEIRTIAPENGRRFESAIISPGGRWLAADDGVGDLHLWNLETGDAQPGVPIKRKSRLVYAFGPDDDTLFVSEGPLKIWDVKQAREAGVVKDVEKVELMSVSPDGHSLVIFGQCRPYRDVCVCSVDQKNVAASADSRELFTPKPKPIPLSEIRTANFHPPTSTLDSQWDAVDLVYTRDDRILLTFRGPVPVSGGYGVHATDAARPSYQSCFLKPGDLTMLEKTVVDPERGWLYPGIRSTLTAQLEAVRQ